MSIKQGMDLIKLRRRVDATEALIADLQRRIHKLETAQPVKRGPGRPRKNTVEALGSTDA